MTSSVSTADDYEFVGHDETELSPEVLARIRKWLQPTDCWAESGELRRHLSAKAPGTGLWICATDEYRTWHDSADHGCLWIEGAPGAGKSVIAASVIQHLRRTGGGPVLFFFFRNTIAAKHSPRALLQDWLAQLLPSSPKLQSALESRLQGALADTSDGDLLQLLLDGISCVPRLYCVADALDEMASDNEVFLEHLNTMAKYRTGLLKLFLTSRPDETLQSALPESSIVHISLRQQLVDADIMAYLNHRFDPAAVPEGRRRNKQQVVDMVARRCKGSFLSAKSTMDQVEYALLCEEPRSMQALEGSLTVALEQTYKRGISTDVQLFVLEAVTHASRPLRLNELACLLEFVHPGMETPAGHKALVAASCGGLLKALEDETLQVVHHSLTEFLRDDARNADLNESLHDFPVIDSMKAQKGLAVNCIRYVQSCLLLYESAQKIASSEKESSRAKSSSDSPGFDVEYRHGRLVPAKTKTSLAYQEACMRHPFLLYAMENWSHHAGHYDVHDEDFFAAVGGFLESRSSTLWEWFSLQWDAAFTRGGNPEAVPTVLHAAAYCGLTELARDAIGKGSFNGHSELASLLMASGSDADAGDECRLKPIHLAAQKNHATTVQTLLEAGVEPDSPVPRHDGWSTTDYESAIHYACKAGHTETIIAMMPYCNSAALEQLLCECCRFNRVDAALAVLEGSRIQADAMFAGASALHFACSSISVGCVEALVRRGADAGKLCTVSWRTLPRVMELPSHPIAYASLDRLVKAWDHRRSAACQTILRIPQSNAIVLRALLDAGADPNATDGTGWSVLQRAVGPERNVEAAGLFLEHGSDPNYRNPSGQTALHCAAQARGSGRREIIECLLRHGADPGIKDDRGKTSVEDAMNLDSDAFQFLLTTCNDVALMQRCWFNVALQKSTKNEAGFAAYVDFLLAEGVDIEARDSDGRTLLLTALTSEHRTRILLERGAKAHVVDDAGNNALHLLCQRSSCTREHLEHLMTAGADHLRTNNRGEALLHHVAPWYDHKQETAELVRWLARLGLPINAHNKEGRTALHEYERRAQGILFVPDAFTVHFCQAIKETGTVEFQTRDQDGLAALHLAAMRSGVEVAVLVEAGADVNCLTEDGQHALHLACRARKPDIVGRLLRHHKATGSNHKDKYGRTPLHYACASGEPESVYSLIQDGADANAVDASSRTPLHACAESALEQRIWDGHELALPWLRHLHSDPLRPNISQPFSNNGPWYQNPNLKLPPCSVASRLLRVRIVVELLLKAGSNPAAMTRDGFTALDVALQKGCSEFIEPFAADEELFLEATSRLRMDSSAEGSLESIRKCLGTRMALMRPRMSLQTLEPDSPILSEIKEHPVRYLIHLGAKDAASLINQGFEADPLSMAHYSLLEELVATGNKEVMKSIPQLVLHYSSFDSGKKKIMLAREAGDEASDGQASTTLQLVCSQPTPSMLMLQLLVEELHVGVNAQQARTDDQDRSKPQQIIQGGTALHVLASAQSWWHLEAMKYLLEHGAAVDALDARGQFPLHIAARRPRSRRGAGPCQLFWRLAAIRILLDHGANPNLLTKKNSSPLLEAAWSPDIMRELLSRGADRTIGASSLLGAIAQWCPATMEMLLDKGTSVDSFSGVRHYFFPYWPQRKQRKVYALLCAACPEYPVRNDTRPACLIRILVQRGANLDLALNEDETLLHAVFECADHIILDGMLQEPRLDPAQLDRRDQRGRTVLMAACDWRQGSTDFDVQGWKPNITGPPLRILDIGADATLTDNRGRTALHHVLSNPSLPKQIVMDFICRDEVAPTLLTKDEDAFSPLHYALRLLQPLACKLLLARGANLFEPDPEGRTALHYIARHFLAADTRLERNDRFTGRDRQKDHLDQCLRLWRSCVAQGADVNGRDHAGNTPLHADVSSSCIRGMEADHGSKTCHVDYYDRLFPAGCGVDVHAANHEGETALHVIAKRNGRRSANTTKHDKALFEMMLDKGLDPLREDAWGRSALDVASACGKDAIVSIFARK
ncbi:hypothetical protein S7711_09307 [Stachybotrys chartarum IBT 7711]|uniref:Uncharacterized protein n=1 Tax=Stachybotrys chartarum (strain CBS 109288 / IBT 7711) TaxID=1280523 RepID=A0A084AG38_STACB|nr:hypothetical protein S7711_09307 [Stachybotrys chartarum IBT 7711]